MPAAARVDDPITHTEAHSEGITQMLEGALVGAAIGVALIGFTVLTGGTGLILIGAAVAAGGTVLSMGGKGFLQGAKQGATHVDKHGQVKTGSGNVTINKLAAAAACLSVIECDEHSGPQKLAQGSRTVTINGRMASRVGDRSTCDGVIGAGSGDVTIGGAMGQCAAISKEVADWEMGLAKGAIIVGTVAQLVGAVMSGVGIVGAIRAAPAAIRAVLAARAGAGLLGSLGFGAVGSHYGGQWFGEGSWQQEALGTVSALVGGGLIGKASGMFGKTPIPVEAPPAEVVPESGPKLLPAPSEPIARTPAQEVADLPGHGNVRHGTKTTLAEQTTRAQTGIAPDGQQANTTRATRFDSDEAQLDAVNRAKARTAARVATGQQSTAIVVKPNGVATLPSDAAVVTGRPGGYGSGVEVLRNPTNNQPLPGRPVQPTGQDMNARVVLRYSPLSNTFEPYTQFPTNEPVTP